MLTVTPAARKRLSRRLQRMHAAEDVAMRFTRRKNGWRLRPDRTGPKDTAIEHEGRQVLLLDEAVSRAMTDLRLEVRTTTAGPRLKLRRPSGQVE